VARAILKTTDLCATDPTRMARQIVDGGFTPRYDYALQTLSEVPYDKWREYDAEDTVRFFALRLRDAGFIKSSPQKIHFRRHGLALLERAHTRAEGVRGLSSPPRRRGTRESDPASPPWIPAFAQDCPGKIERQFVRAFCREFWFEKPLARARPGHPRLEPAMISAPKTWMAGPSPRLSGSVFCRNRKQVPEMTDTTRVPRGRTWS
jgi:hypothetical protein